MNFEEEPVAHASLTIVCLPQDTPTRQLAAAATARLAATPVTGLGPARHFVAGTRLRRASLLQPGRTAAAGGPVRLLDLDAMRRADQQLYWYRWCIWNQVVAGTRPARPYWAFVERHRADPGGYPIDRAQRHYLAQPRIAAMLTYNALPNKVVELPTSHLEAFQTGGHSYAHYGWLSAVPADGVLCLDRLYLAARSDEFAARIVYLAEANRYLAALGSRDIVVALHTR
jgi:hypothetical protein